MHNCAFSENPFLLETENVWKLEGNQSHTYIQKKSVNLLMWNRQKADLFFWDVFYSIAFEIYIW